MISAKYLLDTDWVVPMLWGRAAAQTLFTTLAPSGLAISLITYAEIYEGIYFGANRTQHEQSFLTFLQSAALLPLDEPIMEQFAHVRGQLRAAGNLIPDFDLVIAATALHHQLTLVTRNKKHFQRVPGLSLY